MALRKGHSASETWPARLRAALEEALAGSSTIVLSCKPQNLAGVFRAASGHIGDESLVSYGEGYWFTRSGFAQWQPGEAAAEDGGRGRLRVGAVELLDELGDNLHSSLGSVLYIGKSMGPSSEDFLDLGPRMTSFSSLGSVNCDGIIGDYQQ